MNKRIKLELKVGLFVVIGLVILIIFIFSVRKPLGFGKGRYHIKIVFSNAEGLKVNSPVRFLGVDVGEIKKMDLSFSPEKKNATCIITVSLRKDMILPSDSVAYINSLGLLGEKYIEISPGKNYEDLLKEDDYLLGRDSLSIYEFSRRIDTLISTTQEILERIKGREGTVGRLLYDDSLYLELEELVKDLRKHPWKLLHRPKEKRPKEKK